MVSLYTNLRFNSALSGKSCRIISLNINFCPSSFPPLTSHPIPLPFGAFCEHQQIAQCKFQVRVSSSKNCIILLNTERRLKKLVTFLQPRCLRYVQMYHYRGTRIFWLINDCCETIDSHNMFNWRNCWTNDRLGPESACQGQARKEGSRFWRQRHFWSWWEFAIRDRDYWPNQ